MPSTFTAIEIGKSALLASRRAMDTTGHNIANAATPGYSRQQVILEPIIQRVDVVSGTSGLGVRVVDVQRIRDPFIDGVLRGEQAKKAGFESQKEVLDHLQILFAEPSDSSMRNFVDAYWAAWHDLASEPQSQAARAQLMETGCSVADMFRHLGSQIDSLTGDVEAAISSTVTKVNLLSERICSLNTEISRALARKEPVGDLMDRRDLLIDELTELTGATVSYLDEGTVKVSIGGIPIVDKYKSYPMSSAITSNGVEFYVVTGPNDSDKLLLSGVSGALGGYKVARDEIVLKFRDELNSVALKFFEGINYIHQVDPETGAIDPTYPAFFQFSNDVLSTIKVTDEIVNDPGKIRTSIGLDGLDGEIAHAIADYIAGTPNEFLSEIVTFGSGFDLSGGNFTEKWMSIVGKLGVEGQKVEIGHSTQELLVKELANRRDSISGVSREEEITELIREQHAFNAAARLISVADEMLDTIINRMGMSGR
ncbi:MAG TPA: flagellar hook-associated protein FlgK [Bacillota bacterium]|nr:flagellar hook-associated protein FlgK [Bacillota bacterium]HQD74049.1 flagellar hook-associated protein FlgK [Bacillota bacterium]